MYIVEMRKASDQSILLCDMVVDKLQAVAQLSEPEQMFMSYFLIDNGSSATCSMKMYHKFTEKMINKRAILSS